VSPTLWRQLKKSGALSLKTSAYLLPDVPEHYERLQWLAQQVRDGGGEATLIRVTDIESLPRAEIVRLFNEARAADYAELNSELNELLLRNKEAPRRVSASRAGEAAGALREDSKDRLF
jgi:Protein ChrB, N-terminal